MLDLSILGTYARFNPEAAGQRYADAISNAAASAIQFWKTDKARKIMDDYKKWSQVHPADTFDMDAETKKRLGGFDVEKAAAETLAGKKKAYMDAAPTDEVLDVEAPADELVEGFPGIDVDVTDPRNMPKGKPVSGLDPEIQIEEELEQRAEADTATEARRAAAQKRRQEYVDAWDEEKAAKEARTEAEAEYRRRLETAREEAQAAYDGLFDSPEARAEYEAGRERWNPFVGEGAGRRAKYDDERLYEVADAVRWYRPDLAAAIEQRAAQSAQRRMALEARRAQMFSPQAVMQRAQIALDAAVRRRDRIAAQLAGDENNENLQMQLRQAEAQVQAIQASYDKAFQGYFGADLGAGTEIGEGPDVVEAVTKQNRLVSELLPRIGEFETLEDYLEEARQLGASNKSLGALRQAWKQRFDEEQRAKSADQRDRALDQADERNDLAKRNLNLREIELKKAEVGIDKNGVYSDKNVEKAKSIAKDLRNGGEIKTHVSALRKLGYDVQFDNASGGFILFRYGKKVATVGPDDAIKWIEGSYLPEAAAARRRFAGGENVVRKPGNPAKPAKPAAPLSPKEQEGLL